MATADSAVLLQYAGVSRGLLIHFLRPPRLEARLVTLEELRIIYWLALRTPYVH